MALELISVEYEDLKGRIVTFPIGNVGNTMTIRYTLRNEFKVGFSNDLQVKKTLDKLELIGSIDGQPATWEAAGITAGQLSVFQLYGTNNGSPVTIEGTGTVSFINGAILYLTADPDSDPDHQITFNLGLFKQFKTPEGLDIFLNSAKNDAPNQYSLIDGEVQRFQIDNLNFTPVGTTLPMVQLGKRSGGSKMSVTVTLLADGLGDKSKFLVTVSNWRYPNYLDADIFGQSQSVMPYAKFSALAEFANLNAKTECEYAPQGNIGYFNEHFNGGVPPYTPSTIEWRKANNTLIESMDYAQTSKFKAEIIGNFDNACQFNIGWFWHPVNDSDEEDESAYKHKIRSADENLLLVTKTSANSTIYGPESITGYSNEYGAQLTITNLQYTVIGSGPVSTLRITGQTVPNSEFTEWFEQREGDRRFRMWADVDQSAFNSDWNSSTSSNMIIADAQMIKSAVVLGAWDDMQYYRFRDHADAEYSNITAYMEDDINMLIKFRLPKNSIWQSVAGYIEAYNSSIGNAFTLDSQIISIAPTPQVPYQPDGTLPLNVVQSRGFKLPLGSLKNEVHIIRDSTNDGINSYGLQFNYGFLCRWEYWLSQPNAAPYFFNNQYKNWFFFQGNGWSLRFVFELTKDAGSYRNYFPFSIKYYDDYIGTSATTFYKLDGTPIASPLTNEPCRIVVQHDISAYSWIVPEWANITVEPNGGGPRWLLSSFPNVLDHNNPLYPESGEVGVKIVVAGSVATTSCLFDPSKIQGTPGFSFTGRIQGEEDPPVPGKFIFQNGSGILDQNNNNLNNQ